MSAPRSENTGILSLLVVGVLLMAAVAVRGLVRRPVPEEISEPSADRARTETIGPADVGEAGRPAEERRRREQRVRRRAALRIRRREVPGLTEKQIRAAHLSLREAMYYEKLDRNRVQCLLCPTACLLADGERGSCRVRINLGGTLRTIVYGRLVAVHNDPIEKKPLFHFLPGTRAFSIATAGCNLGCVFCQNWQISQAFPECARNIAATPEQVVAAAKRSGCDTISYTYTEPTIFYEFMLDCARLARREGISNIFITCGYINPEPLRELAKVMDGANIDLKGFSEAYYNKYCKAALEPVLTTIKVAREEGMWVEVTNLVIPGANDDPQLIREMCKWLVANVGPDVPLHFSRFHPDYRMLDKPPTPPATLEMAARIAKEEGIRYVYIGNLLTRSGDDTFCPGCGRQLITRRGYEIITNHIRDGLCPHCGSPIAGVWTRSRKGQRNGQGE